MWTSEEPSSRSLREETLATIYRHRYLQRHGPPKTLQQMMRQEGRAASFAGCAPTGSQGLDVSDIEYTREVLAPYLESDEYPKLVAALYGDEMAKEAGYRPMGLSPRAGYAVALSNALTEEEPPEAALQPVH